MTHRHWPAALFGLVLLAGCGDTGGSGYVWTPGEYVPAAGHGQNWLPGHWTQSGGGWVWSPARWVD